MLAWLLLATGSLARNAFQGRPFAATPPNDHHRPMTKNFTSHSFSLLEVEGTVGFVKVRENGAGQFYWFWEAIDGDVNSDSKPLVLWLQGGPGCSGQEANFWEFGPIAIDEHLQPERRNGTWSDYFHLLFIDNPLGAGYSFVVHPEDLSRTEDQLAQDMYTTLQTLAKEFPAWFDREFYIVGHSYSGHYIPVLATLILKQNKGNNGDVYLPLTGIAIGDGWTDPAIQVTTYAEVGETVGIFNHQQAEILKKIQQKTSQLALEGHYLAANDWDTYLMGNATQFAGGINVCNYRVYGGYNDSAVVQWLNLNSTKSFLQVPLDLDWIDCSSTAGDALDGDIMQSYKHLYPNLLKELKVLLYNGQDDFLVNSQGSFLWFDLMDWYGQVPFRHSERELWYHGNSPAGYVQRYERFVRVLVNKAGHLVHHDQLINGRDMVRRFIFDLPWSQQG